MTALPPVNGRPNRSRSEGAIVALSPATVLCYRSFRSAGRGGLLLLKDLIGKGWSCLVDAERYALRAESVANELPSVWLKTVCSNQDVEPGQRSFGLR